MKASPRPPTPTYETRPSLASERAVREETSEPADVEDYLVAVANTRLTLEILTAFEQDQANYQFIATAEC